MSTGPRWVWQERISDIDNGFARRVGGPEHFTVFKAPLAPAARCEYKTLAEPCKKFEQAEQFLTESGTGRIGATYDFSDKE